jgi:hypothetical protein
MLTASAAQIENLVNLLRLESGLEYLRPLQPGALRKFARNQLDHLYGLVPYSIKILGAGKLRIRKINVNFHVSHLWLSTRLADWSP